MAMNGYVDYDSIDCVSQFRVGYRFDPTDDDLMSFYLRKKIFNQPLTFHGILQFDVFQTEPWRLPIDTRNSFSDRKYYFFDVRNGRFENMDIRAAGNGEWRIVEKRKEVSLRRSRYFIGRKNTFEYWKMEGTQVVRSEWMMEEFHIKPILHPYMMKIMIFVLDIVTEFFSSNLIQKSILGAYRVFKRKEAKGEEKVTTPTGNDLTMEGEDESANPSAP
ncbi:NAC domain containing protein 52-like [Vicia villosa]|uniref:NAC domain containing protein 52-like n=1 Tax=Vicia villosa TaxID=3911 RepID=UPI00273C8B63|nr:NAC domain containing protein 52-like [Vicia villosa]